MSSSQDDALAAPIDRGALAEISRGDRAVEHRLLSVFRAANDADIAAIQAAVDKGDAPAVIRAAHRIIGAGRMAGATVLASIGDAIAQAGQAGDWDAIAANNRTLYEELARINAYLDAQFKGLPGILPNIRSK